MPNTTASDAVDIKLYTLDGGLTEFEDAAIFSDTGEYDGEPIALPTPSYLIQHGDQWLLWDTGNGDHLADLPGGVEMYTGRFTQPITLREQLGKIGLQPDDINFVGLSHLHVDHTGNIRLFPRATFLVGAEELAWAQTKPFGVDSEAIAPLATAEVDALAFDRDVFGDGTVRILKVPGHTPGSLMLLLNLANEGPVLLSGDQFHTRQNYEKNLVCGANVSRADTLASSDRFSRIVANTNARVVIQHAPEDFAGMPTFPKYLD
jgi:glyoxylase-like metal-dependent hydrolase (beta-lactamase superfamily II)